jgi:hypothetical protein
MTRNDWALVSASSHHQARLAAACRAVAIGGAVAALAAALSDPSAAAAAKDHADATVQNVPAQDTSPVRGDAAELDAMRLEIADVRASLR